jgi:hypothetical protein
MRKIVWVLFGLLIALVMGCGGGGGNGDNNPTVAAAVVIGGTPINSAPPAPTTSAGTPVISNLVLNPNTARVGDRLTFNLAFTDTGADVNTFGIQLNGENKYYSYNVSGVASGNLAFNLTVQDTIGNVQPGSYQIIVFIIDRPGNVSNYLTGTLTVQGSSPPTTTVDVTGTWRGTVSMNWSDGTSSTDNTTLNLTQAGTAVTGTFTNLDGTLNCTGSVSGSTFTLSMTLPCGGGNRTLTLSHNVSGSTMTATSASGSAYPNGIVNIVGYSGTLIK